MESKERKTDSILIKATPSEHEAIKKAAKILGISKSEFLLGTVRKQVAEVFAGNTFRLIHKAKDGVWRFKGRRLDVFSFYYMLYIQDEFSDEEWADMYGLSKQHVSEARKLCELVVPGEYAAKVAEFEAEDRELSNAPPY